MKASMFYRVAAVLLLLFAVGHTLSFRQSDPKWSRCPSAQWSIPLTCRGSTARIGTSFVAAGFSVGVFYLFAAILAWQLVAFRHMTLALMRGTA